ncbi:MAG: hypothetical protein EZS28_021750 [Streblomastix strix]|uniref:Uncharacterized protein n=1 Tax=Streblomastix strix TaxID=222440 RepID=A0A5J4VJQ5_9EUKA|nr:MAG: hypothetical protein EZS28_021750 [Streblomastix strix]
MLIFSEEKSESDQNTLQSLIVKGFRVTSLLRHFEFLHLISLGSRIKSYPQFCHIRCAVYISVLCGDKYGIVILGIISSRKPSSSDSSVPLQQMVFEKFVVADMLVLVELTDSVHFRLQLHPDTFSRLFILQLGPLIEQVESSIVNLLHYHQSKFKNHLLFTVGSPQVKMDSVVGQLGTELVKQGIALFIQSIGRGTVVVTILKSFIEEVGSKRVE